MQGHNPFRESSTVMLLHPRVQHHRNRRGRRLRLAQPFHPHVQDPGGLTHPTGARRRVERTPFGNSGRPLTAPNSCLNNNFSCLNDNFLPKRQNWRPELSSSGFSVNFVLELFGPKPCFPSSKIPLLYVRPSEAKG